MRKADGVNLNIKGIDWEQRLVAVTEKGGMTHSYPISDQGLQAIKDYITHERHLDNTDRLSALFLPAMTTHNSNGRLTPLVVNQEWEEVCAIANISHKTPHAARHAMGLSHHRQDGQYRPLYNASLVIEMSPTL